jgi:hypothetical protein
MNLKWRINRLRAMSAAEISSRTVLMLRSRLEHCGIGLARAAAPSRAAGAAWLPPALPTAQASRTQLFGILPHIEGDGSPLVVRNGISGTLPSGQGIDLHL